MNEWNFKNPNAPHHYPKDKTFYLGSAKNQHYKLMDLQKLKSADAYVASSYS